ncbi:hypothetical protein V8F20_007103 [Naviculisporaceae sp. PSN 640]
MNTDLPIFPPARVVKPPVFMEVQDEGLRVPIFLENPRCGFKKLPGATTSTFPRPSQPSNQRLSPLSSVTNAEEEEGDELAWNPEPPRRPMTAKWRQVCATSPFPVLSEPPRRWDGSRQTMQEFLASLVAREKDDKKDDRCGWESDSQHEEYDPKLQRFKTQLENIARAYGLDHSRFVEWMTDPSSGAHTFTTTAPPPQAQKITTPNGTEEGNTRLKVLADLVAELDALSRDHSAPTGYFFSDITRVKWRLNHLSHRPSSSSGQPTEATADASSPQPGPDRISIITQTVTTLAALVDPLAPPNQATLLMADVVDAYLDAHYSQIWVDAEYNCEELEELRGRHYNEPPVGEYEEGFRGQQWAVLRDQADTSAVAGDRRRTDGIEDG